MHASGLSVLPTAILLFLTAPLGCRSSRSDHTVQVTQAPAAQQAEIQPPPSRLGRSSDAQTAAASFPEGDGAEFARLASLETSGMIDGEGDGASRAAFMEAFRDADPQVREAFRRRLMATVATQPAETAATSSAAIAGQRALAALPTPKELAAEPTPPADAPAQPAQAALSDQAGSAEPTTSDAPTAPAAAAATALTASPTDADADAALAGFVLPPGQRPDTPADADAVAAASEKPETEPPATADGSDAAPAADEVANETKPPAAETPSTADGAAPPDARLLETLIDRWAEAAADETETAALRRQLKHRILLTLDGRIDQAVEPIPGMDASEQEYLRHQLLALWTAIDPEGHPVPQRRWSAALPQLREATNYLAAATGTLEVRSLTFCTEVESYGRLTRFDDTRFAAGQQVILYSELENFAAERLSDGYETHFQGAYEIFDRTGKRVADRVLPPDRQVCNNYRRDYFIAYRLHLPTHLEPGHYRMEVTMEDLKGKKYGQSNIEFEIVAQR